MVNVSAALTPRIFSAAAQTTDEASRSADTAPERPPANWKETDLTPVYTCQRHNQRTTTQHNTTRFWTIQWGV